MLNPKNDDAEKYNTVTYKNSRLPIRKSTSFWSDVVHLCASVIYSTQF